MGNVLIVVDKITIQASPTIKWIQSNPNKMDNFLLIIYCFTQVFTLVNSWHTEKTFDGFWLCFFHTLELFMCAININQKFRLFWPEIITMKKHETDKKKWCKFPSCLMSMIEKPGIISNVYVWTRFIEIQSFDGILIIGF